jgi:glycosyltransferase involved in cell wall biosynthesis
MAPEPAAPPDLAGLRVLMLTPSYAPRVGGVEKHVARVAGELAARGLQVTVATPRWDSAWPAEEATGAVRVLRLSPDRRAGTRELGPLVRQADLVHTHDAYPFLKYYLPYRFSHPFLPVVVTFHGYEGYPIPWEARLLRRLVLGLTRDRLCAGAFIPRWYHFDCDLITHGGTDAPAQRPPLGEGAVFVGRLEPDTGFLQYLEALALLKAETGACPELQVIGDGSLRAAGEALAREASLPATFHGRLADPGPSLRQARYALVSGYLAILDAMAAGSLVLALHDNPLKHDYLRLFPGASLMVVAASPRELADWLTALGSDPASEERLAAAAFDFAATQSWDRVADLTLDLYRRGLGGRWRR